MAEFVAQIDKWIAANQERMRAVKNASIQRVIEIAQEPVGGGGNMPVDTGFLRASQRTAIGNVEFTPREPPVERGTYTWSPDEVSLVLAGAPLEASLSIGWSAVYARRVEYGFSGTDSLGRVYNQQGRAFLRRAAQRWPSIVDAVSAELRVRTEGAG